MAAAPDARVEAIGRPVRRGVVVVGMDPGPPRSERGAERTNLRHLLVAAAMIALSSTVVASPGVSDVSLTHSLPSRRRVVHREVTDAQAEQQSSRCRLRQVLRCR